jgi:hypothetical protein
MFAIGTAPSYGLPFTTVGVDQVNFIGIPLASLERADVA